MHGGRAAKLTETRGDVTELSYAVRFVRVGGHHEKEENKGVTQVKQQG